MRLQRLALFRISLMNIRTNLLRAVCFAAASSFGPAGSVVAATTNLDESIRQIRMGKIVIEAAPGADIRVEQLRHEFWFGAALASQMFRGGPDSEEADRYKKVFLENFNAAVTENALKWHSMEQRKGEVSKFIIDAIKK